MVSSEEKAARKAVAEFGAVVAELCSACDDRHRDLEVCWEKNCIAVRLLQHIEAILDPERSSSQAEGNAQPR